MSELTPHPDPYTQSHIESLLENGYEEITEYKNLKVGQRVCHTGQRWPGAQWEGTATIERMFKSPRLIQGRDDVELVAKRDRAGQGLAGYGYWADYHTEVAEEQR